MRILLDSSALAKRYIAEPGSAAVGRICQSADEIVLSSVTLPEILSALNRLRRESKLDDMAYTDLKSEIMADFNEVNLVGLILNAVQTTQFTRRTKAPNASPSIV